MQLSYSSFKNDITSFNSEEYIKTLQNSVSYSYFINFVENYKEIENEDFKKPIFSQTTKFKKTPSNYKNYKYLKINRDEEEKNIWVFENPNEEHDKISILIKTYLNKISQDTYKNISTEFINELILIKNINLFELLSKEILNKCLYDNKYRNLYINLCYKIWSNKQIHYNLVNIVVKDNNYYWSYNNLKLEGPFLNEISAKNDIFNKINFKKFLLNYIQILYKTKDLSLNNLDDDEYYVKKKKILLLVELIGIMFLEKYINFDIINIIIIDLLHLNNNFKNIEEIEIEILYVLIKLIKDNKNNFNDLAEHKYIFNDFINIIQKIIDNNNELTKRSIFFLNDIIIMFNSFTNQNNEIKNDKNIFFEKIKNNELYDLLQIYKTINKNDSYNIIYKCIELFINQTTINKTILNLLIDIKNSDLIYDVLEKITENINDIILDIPNVDQKILQIIKNIDNVRKNKILFIINNLHCDSDSDGESDDEK